MHDMRFRQSAVVLAWCLLLVVPLLPAMTEAQTAGATKPNVLFIAIDDLNDWVGFLGGHPQALTPTMDRLARQGMVFTSAQCAAPLCCPSRTAIFSGQWPYTTGVYDNSVNIRRLHPDKILLPQYFAANGYTTYGTGKLLHYSTPEIFDDYFKPEQRWSPLADETLANYTTAELATKTTRPRHLVEPGSWGRNVILPLNGIPSDRNPDKPAGESFDWGPFDVADEEMGDAKITTWAIERLKRHTGKPFFLGVGYYRPHIPLWAPKKYFDLYPEASIQLPEVLESDLEDLSAAGRKWALDPVTAGAHQTVVKYGQWKAAVRAYLACVSFVDAQIGRLLEALEHSPYADNTVIVIWGDHGWHLGEKQHWGKWTGWDRATKVPLVVIPSAAMAAGLRTGAACDRPVSLVDLYPTLIDLCGLPAKNDLDGTSLRPLLANPDALRIAPVITTFDFGNYSVRTERWRFIHYADGTEELYDRKADPQEWRNLAGETQYDALRGELRSHLPKSAAAPD